MIWVIEPHSDDAFLSLHQHIKNWIKEGQEVSILTIYSSHKRDAEGRAYAESIGAGYKSLTIPWGNGLKDKIPILPSFKTWGIGNYTQLVFPLGLQHPEHLAVRSHAPKSCWFYLDTPYQAKQKLAEDLQAKIENMKVVSILYPNKIKWKSIDFFKSQAKFFYFNPASKLQGIPEILLHDNLPRYSRSLK